MNAKTMNVTKHAQFMTELASTHGDPIDSDEVECDGRLLVRVFYADGYVHYGVHNKDGRFQWLSIEDGEKLDAFALTIAEFTSPQGATV